MDWHARDDAPQDETIRQQLLTKGFPSYVLDDLTAEEVSRMAGAVRVYRQVERLYSDTDHRTITTTHYMSDRTVRWSTTTPSPTWMERGSATIPTSTVSMIRWSRP